MVSGAVSGGFLWVSGGFRGFRQLSLAFLDAPTAETVVSYGFPEVPAVSGNFLLRFSMHPKAQTARTDHTSNKTHRKNRKSNLPLFESDRGRITLSIFLAPRVEFKRMREFDSVAIVARAMASSPWQAPAP